VLPAGLGSSNRLSVSEIPSVFQTGFKPVLSLSKGFILRLSMDPAWRTRIFKTGKSAQSLNLRFIFRKKSIRIKAQAFTPLANSRPTSAEGNYPSIYSI
jgi:hypothetical protein